MPPLPGEERLLTVFADIHYYFAAPTLKPLHHRFDKGSYLYIYQDASQNKARVEIANNPGTPEQDAFHGALHNVHIRHSTHFPTLCTLTVDGVSNAPQPQHASQYEWRLPSGDPRNERHSLLRLHTLDIYFWTLDDANQFLDTAGHVLEASQVKSDRTNTIPQPEQPMSSVVQQLENIAVSDPAYQNGQTRNSRSDSAPTSAPASQGTHQPMSFPPPPPSGPPADQQANIEQNPENKKEPENFAPLPYNPAAPAAPEPIKHREKTPPPEDGTEGTGLMAAVAADHGIPYTPSQKVGGVPSFGPPPTSTPGAPYPGASAMASTGYSSPPPSAGLPRSATFPLQQTLPSPGLPSYNQAYRTGQAWPGSPPEDPNAHLFAQQAYGSPQSPPQQLPIGGYSNYSYNQSVTGHTPGSSEYDIHSQVYRPTEAEAGSHGQKYAARAMKAPGQRPRKLEDNAAKLESGMNRFLKKLEKKL
ncbi:hypothetical protein N7448_006269 [Penicillium atrosanguineum]|uniref:RNA recognition motif-containing protein n=1 Tax=Penicillium atrosanguineum TaxID=1132637 RepID=A0A9W9L2B5_9EURO|nr:hypothetical protein N7448_006269 [Penicillium atrosanguineum]KAJ5137679.1 hypothetical protein N7526_003912 [Penicillium atrosanguineum]KAJ5307599.1 hypothetical protein N7476_008255 [Penicillium atrosanguineum]